MRNKTVQLFIPIIILMSFSILCMINSRLILAQYENYYFKQILWFIIGFLAVIVISKIKRIHFFKYSYIIYGINILFLVLVLFFGKEVNGAKAWFDMAYFSFQPSEFMKLSLLLILCHLSNSLRLRTIKNELKFIGKAILLTIIPAILTFVQPDTGAVIIYFIITTAVLFASCIRYRWFIIGATLLFTSLAALFFLYHNYQDFFLEIFGSSLFYRIDRIMLFNEGSGMQIENAKIAIGNAGIFGNGINSPPIYFPEAPTDFIFALLISNFGYLGALIIIISYIFIFIWFIKVIKRTPKKEHKIFITAFLAMFLFQVMGSILMNIGLLPVIGITLPFLSYGGSSLLLYFICIGMTLKIIKKY